MDYTKIIQINNRICFFIHACIPGEDIAVVEYESNDIQHCFRDKLRSYPA